MVEPFRQSYAKTLLSHPPARLRYELDNPTQKSEPMITGSLVDAMVFMSDLSGFAFSEFEEFRTKEAKEWRDSQIANGKMIVRKRMLSDARDMAAAVSSAIASEVGWEPSKDDIGKRTQVPLSWYHNGDLSMPCIGTADIVDRCASIDLKVTDIRISDYDAVIGHIIRMGWHIQGFAYTSALEQINQEEHSHVIILVESEPPHCFRSVRLSPGMIELGRRSFDKAAREWFSCQRLWRWGRGGDPIYAEAPAWAISREERGEQ